MLLQYYSALRENVEAIITRNTKDFANSSLPVFTPDEVFITDLSIARCIPPWHQSRGKPFDIGT